MTTEATSSFLFILFGATGDLAAKKLLPALYSLSQHTDADFTVLGVGRSDWDDAAFQDYAQQEIDTTEDASQDVREWTEKTLQFVNVPSYDDYSPLFERLEEFNADLRIYYLATPPGAFTDLITRLGEYENEQEDRAQTKLVIEKPFGRDLDSARALNEVVHSYFEERQVYRIDHYLGKETVQNLLVFRFANALFEPLWNRTHIDHVDILVAETGDLEGRAGYYDGVGVIRDMIQNHLSQLFTLVAMEPPATLDADAIHHEKIKVLHATTPPDLDKTQLGQYGEGETGGAYISHERVPANSSTPTYASVELRIDNWRWQGVPFTLRTGKRMPEDVTEIRVSFRCPPVTLFEGHGPCDLAPNTLTIRLQPHEGFGLSFEVKQPGDGFALSTQSLAFRYDEAFGPLRDAYETLLHDVVTGDRTLFVHAAEAEASWSLYAPLLEADLPVLEYPSGTWGPSERVEA